MRTEKLSNALGLLITNEEVKLLYNTSDEEFDKIINDSSLTINELNIKCT